MIILPDPDYPKREIPETFTNEDKKSCCNFYFYSKPIQKWITSIFDKWLKENIEEDFIGNFRVACTSYSKHVLNYEECKADGCCGFDDWEAVGPDGKKYKFGTNFGH